MAIFFSLNSLYSVLIFGTILTLLGVAVAIVHPQHKRIHYVLDCIILMLLSVLFFTFTGFFCAHITLLLHRFQSMVDLVSFLVHLSTLHALCSIGLLQERGFHSGFFHFVMKKIRNANYLHSNEKQQLLGES